MRLKTRLLLCSLIAAASLQAQVDKNDPLFISLKQQDSLFFERGFNQCDLDYLEQAVHPDLVFFHDQGGFQNRTVFFENVKKNLCADANQKPIRKLVAGSLEVYPLYNNGQLYGAIQNGVHAFFIREPGKPDVPTSIAKFTHLYLQENGNWILREVLSFDHKGVDPAPAQDAPDDILWTVAWSPDGRFVAAGGKQHALRIFSGTQFEPIDSFPVKYTITSLKWHPSLPLLAVATQLSPDKPFLLNLETGERTVLNGTAIYGARAIGWNADGSLLAVGDNEGQLSLFSKDGTRIRTIDLRQKSITGLDWHPAENSIVTVGHHIALYDVDQDKITAITPRPEEVLMLCVAWHPTGAFFATGDYGDYEKKYPPLLQFWGPDGQQINNIAGSKAEYRNLRWSPDGNRLATASDALRIWSIDGEPLGEGASEALLWGVDWSPDGRQIASSDAHGTILVWETGPVVQKQVK